MTTIERKRWVVRELFSMTLVRKPDPKTMMGRKRRLLREIHTLWPSHRIGSERAIRAVAEAVRASGKRGMTGDELERSLRMLHQSLGRPLLMARHRGLIKDSGRRRKTRNNREAVVWVDAKKNND